MWWIHKVSRKICTFQFSLWSGYTMLYWGFIFYSRAPLIQDLNTLGLKNSKYVHVNASLYMSFTDLETKKTWLSSCVFNAPYPMSLHKCINTIHMCNIRTWRALYDPLNVHPKEYWRLKNPELVRYVHRSHNDTHCLLLLNWVTMLPCSWLEGVHHHFSFTLSKNKPVEAYEILFPVACWHLSPRALCHFDSSHPWHKQLATWCNKTLSSWF